ncbi:MAG: Uma2 family endonuclease [Ginsengibacter sp.]
MKLFFEKADIDVKGFISDNMSEKEFFNFCQQNESLRIERDDTGQIFIMAPTSSETGSINFRIAAEIVFWNKIKKSGVAFDSSTGFTLHDNSVLSPDVSWILNEKWNKISKKDKERFAHICPDFVIEFKKQI